jgi:uncharacterized membrane protein YqjE
MVREAQMNGGNGNGEPPYGTGADAPQRVVARNFRELVGDVMTLGELQWQLFRVDLEQMKAQAVVPIVVLAAGAVLLLSCVPIALVALAICLNEFTKLTPAAAFLIALAVGLVLGGLLCLFGAWRLRSSLGVMKRSQNELGQNYRWLKKMLGRLSSGPFRRKATAETSFNS